MLQDYNKTLHAIGRIQFYVRVTPNAPITAVTAILEDESIKIKIAAPSERNRANQELVRFLAKQFEVHTEQLHIVSGGTSRHKLIRIEL